MSGKIFESAIQAALHLAPENQDIAHYFLSTRNNAKRYVIGKNAQSAELILKYKIDGVVDDFDRTNSHWMGVPVTPAAQLPPDAIVVNCSTSISPVAVSENLARVGIRNILGINELIHASQDAISMPWFVKEQREDVRQHFQSYNRLHEFT